MSESPSSGSGASGLLARIASSAEYSIAAALLVVCLVVGAAFWWLGPSEQDAEQESSSSEASSPSAVAPAEDEQQALNEARKALGERFGAIDEQQRKRAAEDDARRERQRSEQAEADARRQSEQASQARQQAEAKAREQAAVSRPAPPVALAAPAAPAPRRPAEIVDAAIDWSSCRRPNYPSGSVRRGEEGVVVIAVDLDAAAKIKQARVSQSSGHEALDRVTLEAVRKCGFSSAREDGVAKASTAEVRFTWKLQN